MSLSEPTGAPPPAPFNMRPYWQMLVLIAIFAAGPSVVVYLASALADLNHCTIIDAGPTPCLIFGQDRGGLLYDMATFVQVSFVTMPIGILLGFLWISVLIISLMAWRRKRSGVADATRMDVNFGYYGLALIAILAIGYATLSGWLPAPVLMLVAFVGVFWILSFLFALFVTLRGKARAK
jgi:hypothetical protein